MDHKTVIADLRGFINELTALGLTLDSQSPVEVSAEGGTQHVISWSKSTRLSESFGQFATIDEYVRQLQARDFHAVLLDGSFLQFSYTFVRDDLRAHRLCYYPCPIDIVDLELGEISIVEWIEGLSATELRERLRLRTPVRFDFAPHQATDGHPASHFTISRDTCRIEVGAPVSLGHFVRFVFENFYPDLWQKHDFLRKQACHQWNTTLTAVDVDRLYVHWRKMTVPEVEKPSRRGARR